MAQLSAEIEQQRCGWAVLLTVVAFALGLAGLSLRAPAMANIAGSTFDAGDGVPDTAGGTRSLTTVSDQPSGNTDDTYAGDGAAEPALCPSVDLSHAAPQKADILSFSYGSDASAPGVLYLAWTRKFAGGTLAVDFEFNRESADCGNGVNPVRQHGDLMVVYEFDGGSVQAVEVRTWDGGAWSDPITVPVGAAEAGIAADKLFGELSIDLTHPAFGIFDPGDCKAFATGWAKTRTGNSFSTSKVKDFVTPRRVTVSNCASLRIVKDATPDSADDFGFSASGDSVTHAADVPATFVLDDDADVTISNTRQFLVHPQRVTVAEEVATGWQLAGISCTGVGAGKLITSVSTRSLSGALAAPDDITCTFVNARPNTLTIVKDAVPDNGRDFSFAGTGTGVAGALILDDDAEETNSDQASFSGLRSDTYTVTESPAAGWSLTGIACTGATVIYEAADGAPAASGTWAPGHDRASIALAGGQSPTCTFTNTKTVPTIVTTKTPTPTSVPEPGADVRFDVTVENTSPLRVKITDLSDDVYGDLSALAAPPGGTRCAVGADLATGETYSCSFVAGVVGNAGETHTDVVSATAVDADGMSASHNAAAAVTITDVLPEITVTKTPSAIVVRSGDTVTFTYVVRNVGVEEVTLTISDDECDPITGPAAFDDADGDGKLDMDETWTMSCASALTTTTRNVVTATGTDDEGNSSVKTDDATVTVIKPAIAISKTPSATSVAPGTTVVYTYLVSNPGDVALTSVSVADDKCSPVTQVSGDADGDGILDVDETWVFRCSQVQTGAADIVTNVGTATGTDPLGGVVRASDTVTVALVAPLSIDRPAAPAAVVPSQAPAAAPAAGSAPAVGATAPLTLPRTGIDVDGWIRLGASLIFLGLTLLVTAGRCRRTA